MNEKMDENDYSSSPIDLDELERSSEKPLIKTLVDFFRIYLHSLLNKNDYIALPKYKKNQIKEKIGNFERVYKSKLIKVVRKIEEIRDNIEQGRPSNNINQEIYPSKLVPALIEWCDVFCRIIIAHHLIEKRRVNIKVLYFELVGNYKYRKFTDEIASYRSESGQAVRENIFKESLEKMTDYLKYEEIALILAFLPDDEG